MGRIRPLQSLSSGSGLVPPFEFHSRSGISLQVRCMDLSSFSADLRQVILGLPRCLFPSGVQNKLALATSPESFLNTCPIHVHFLRVMPTIMSSCLQMFRTSRLDTFCGHLMPFSLFAANLGNSADSGFRSVPRNLPPWFLNHPPRTKIANTRRRPPSHFLWHLYFWALRILSRGFATSILDKIDGKFETPLPPKSRTGKWRVLAFARLHPCFGGIGVCCSILFCPRLQSWTKKMGNLKPPSPPNQGRENGAFWLLRGFILALGGDGGLLFHFILSKIVGPHRVTLAFPSKQQTIVVTRVGKDIVQIWDRFLYFAAGLASCLGLYWCCRYLSLATLAQLSCASHPHLSASLKKW